MLFRKKLFKSEAQKAAEALPKKKKVQYTPQKLEELIPLLNESPEALLALEPVNYYASKNEFLQCTFYYSDDYSSVYFIVEFYRFDSVAASTPFYRADYELMRRALRKFGQQI
ncbi:MAG: hypothetical protein NC084_01770 [Bacteroides sp.]|nr:hypothetical protein [Eubacterium sp.]MCM1417386.1 hypothetical protein [Roseburia sp.]MCM1461422.1 hypothetical protein [Bacteroides sp.]